MELKTKDEKRVEKKVDLLPKEFFALEDRLVKSTVLENTEKTEVVVSKSGKDVKRERSLKYRLRRAIDTLIQLILILLPNKVRKRLTYKRKVNDKEDIPRVERLRKELEPLLALYHLQCLDDEEVLALHFAEGQLYYNLTKLDKEDEKEIVKQVKELILQFE